jgi:16S rRNA (adenine1518-N6/adenine1519-N6)-dimethyltransferase
VTVRKRFGQHFLERPWVDKLVEAIAPRPGQHFLEIGPGRGALTAGLLARGASVHAVEIDRDLAAALEAQRLERLSVCVGDFLEVPTRAWWNGAGPFRVAANLPYNLSTPILLRLLALAGEGVLTDATLMLQKEVVDRLVATPGTSDWGPLAIATQLGADVRRLFVLPPGAFRPPPAVQSAVVHLAFRPAPVTIPDRAAFDALIRHLFTMRRKTLGRALRPLAEASGVETAAWLAAAGLPGAVRAETLDIETLARLAATRPHPPS